VQEETTKNQKRKQRRRIVNRKEMKKFMKGEESMLTKSRRKRLDSGQFGRFTFKRDE
jgi:hypothetical protein